MNRNFTPYSTRLVMAFMCAVLTIGCKKSNTDPAPDLAAKLVGTYKLTAIFTSGASTPIAVKDGSLVVARAGTALDAALFTVGYTQASTSASIAILETRTVTLKESGQLVEIYDGSTKLGTWDNNVIAVAGYPYNKTTIDFVGSK